MIKILNEKIQLGKLVGVGFDGAATFSGKYNGMQSLLKKNCHCHLLQLACVQAANHTVSIKHVYTTIILLWKIFHYSPKRLLSRYNVSNFPEFKMVKSCLTHFGYDINNV